MCTDPDGMNSSLRVKVIPCLRINRMHGACPKNYNIKDQVKIINRMAREDADWLNISNYEFEVM